MSRQHTVKLQFERAYNDQLTVTKNLREMAWRMFLAGRASNRSKNGGRKPMFTKEDCDAIRLAYRNNRGLSMAQCARRWNCSPGVIERIISGTYVPSDAIEIMAGEDTIPR